MEPTPPTDVDTFTFINYSYRTETKPGNFSLNFSNILLSDSS